MYEGQTYEVILQRMLDRIPANVDKREGSIIYDALAPAAAELAQMYIELEININLSYADTSSGEYLARRTAEFSVNRHPAAKAQRKGLFYGDGNTPFDVPVGSRFSIGGLNYTVKTKSTTGEFTLECETAGTIGNQQFGSMLPIEYVAGLVRAELTDVLVPGEDEETDYELRKRYLTFIKAQPFGGNVDDYLQKVGEIEGVGAVKVFPTWQGGGTVKCTIIASDFIPPTTELVNAVQTIIDPVQNSGKGLGLAPICHTVKIAGVSSVIINLVTTVTLSPGVAVSQVQAEIEAAFENYLLSLRQSWGTETTLIIRISQIESRILTVFGIVDITGTTLNGAVANITLGNEEIPMRGTVVING